MRDATSQNIADYKANDDVGEPDRTSVMLPPQASSVNDDASLRDSTTPVFDLPPADQPLSWSALVFLAFIVLVGPFTAYLSPHPVRTLVAYYAALLPAVAVFAIIVYRLRDAVVSKSFLLYLVFLTALPGMLVVSIVELIITVVGLVVVLGKSLNPILQEYTAGMSTIANAVPKGADLTEEQRKMIQKAMDALWEHIKAQIPVWKILLLVFLMAFAVAGFSEEMAKYLVGRKHTKLANDGVGCHGVIACASAAALGLAASEHVMYAAGYMAQMGFFSALLQGAYRAVVAFPLHVGTTFWVGTRMARFAVLKEQVSFAKTIGVAILFHGSLDAFAFFSAAEAKSAPWLVYLTIPFNASLILVLMLLCRRSYTAVLEKEGQILDAEECDREQQLSRAPV